MPWTKKDVARHNKSIKTPVAKAKWAKIVNAIAKQSDDEGKAIRIANVMAKKKAKK